MSALLLLAANVVVFAAFALVAAEFQAALQEDVGKVVLGLGVVGFAVVLQRIKLLAHF